MEKQEFHTAKSGWQTRTFERPKPYTLDYDENIKTINNVLMRAKPSTVKGVYVKNVSIATTMGPGIKIDPATI